MKFLLVAVLLLSLSSCSESDTGHRNYVISKSQIEDQEPAPDALD